MPKVQYVGNTRRGTLTPRKMWWPGEILEVGPNVAEKLLSHPNFQEIKPEKKKLKEK